MVTSLGDLHRELNRTDPYYRYDLRVTAAPPPEDRRAVLTSTIPLENGTFVSIDVYARFPQAVVDQPIGGKFTFTVFDEDAGLDIRDAFQAHQDYGASSRFQQRQSGPRRSTPPVASAHRRAQYLADSGQHARCAAR